jgi:hypothetical protein
MAQASERKIARGKVFLPRQHKETLIMKKQDNQETSHRQVQIEDLTINDEQAEEVKGGEASGHYTQMVWAPTRP